MKAGWRSVRLSDVCSYDKDQGAHAGLQYVGLEHIESGTGRLQVGLDQIDPKSMTFRFSAQHVLYGRLRPYLKKVLLPFNDGRCSTEIFPILPSGDLLREYLAYWLLSDAVTTAVNATCTGARMPRADMNHVLDFEFPLPPIQGQQRIVAILDEAFAGIATARTNAERNLKNAGELFETARESALSVNGKGWAEAPLEDLCEIKHGFAFQGEYFAATGDYVLLTPGNFYESGGYRDRGIKQKYYVGEVPQGFVLSQGDLLVAMTEQAAGLLGSPVLIPESGIFLHNQRLGLVSGKAGVPWHNEFFFHVLNTKRVRQEIHESASGVKVRHTSPKKIGKVVVSFPTSVNEQERVATRLEELAGEAFDLQAIYRQKLSALDELKQSLLAKAFAGGL